MKTVMIASAVAMSLSTAAFAEDFDNNGVNFVLERDNVTFGVDTVDGEATALSLGVAVLPHAVGSADADVTLEFEYGIQSEDLSLSAAYGLTKNYGQLSAYADLEAEYTIASGDDKGAWDVTPTIGTSYRVNDKLAAFGEVAYTWNASDDWANAGGTVELGARYALNDDLALTPSLTRTFDTGADETNLNVEVALRF